MQATVTSVSFLLLGVLCLLLLLFFLIRCLTQGRSCPTRCNIDGRTVLVTGADTAVGVELTKELCRRGARVIMAVKVRGKETFESLEAIRLCEGSENCKKS